MTDADRLARYAAELYGAQWQTPLANARGVALRTVQRWASGVQPVPKDVWAEIADELREKGPRCLALAAELDPAR